MRTLRVPGDKSISHRALLLAALGEGRSRLSGLLPSADVRSTAGALRRLGVAVPEIGGGPVDVEGVGLRGLRAPAASLDCGNSGTTTRLLAGVVAGAGVAARFVGDASLSARPMKRVAAPLRAMGARVTLGPKGGLPMTVMGPVREGITWSPEAASAQVKGAILLAGLVGGLRVAVREPLATRDHTERMLRARGVPVRDEDGTIALEPASRLEPLDVAVPADPSSAAFLAGLAALGGPAVALEGVSVNPGRTGAFRALRRMGATIAFEAERDQGGEPVATVVSRGGGLCGITLAAEEIPDLIDELPLLGCVAARAEGETRVTGAGELRVKESDRIRALVANLRAVGADAEELADGFVIRGSDRPLAGSVATHGDHRIAMAFGVLGALAGNAITVDDPSCVAVSYPTFWDDLDALRG